MKERMIRSFWVCVSPIVRLANRLRLCSYKWVNVCKGARRRESFNPLWHHRFYGTPVTRLPDEVNLCGIVYRASHSEGTVTFVEEFTRTRMTFERDHIERESLWYFTASGRVPASHVREAHAWVNAVFGHSFEWRRAA